MRKTLVLSILAAVAAFSFASARCAPIDFEGFADGSAPPVAGTLSITNGLVLTAGQSLNEFEFPPHSGENVLANADALLTFSFLAPTTSLIGYITYAQPVSITLTGHDGSTFSWKTAFSSNTALTGDSGSAPNELFSFTSASTTFASLSLRASSAFTFVVDDLTLAFVPPTEAPGPPAGVPEPSALALLCLCLPLLARSFRQRRVTSYKLVGSLAMVLPLLMAGRVYAQMPLPELVAYPRNAPPAVPTVVTVTVQITDPTYISGSAILNEVDDSGRVMRKLATFVDDATGGDEIAGDRILTARFTANEATPRIYYVVASAGFRGSLLRIASPPLSLFAATDADTRFGFATPDPGKLTFRDSSGGRISEIALRNSAVTSSPGPSGVVLTTVDDYLYISELQTRSGILTNSYTQRSTEDEAAALPSTFRYFGPSGLLLFSVSTFLPNLYFVAPNNVLLSRDGSRILLIEVTSDDRPLKLSVLNDSGGVVFSTTSINTMDAIVEAQLTSNGRFAGLVGRATIGGVLKNEVLVVDTTTGVVSRRDFAIDVAVPVNLAENVAGSFSVVQGLSAGENLP